MKPISAPSAAHRQPWLNRQRLRQAAIAAGALLGLYAVLVLIALVGGPRIGASFLPLPGGGPDPASPVAGLEPSRIPTSGPTIPRGSETPVPTVPPTPGHTTTLPPATTTGPVTTTGQPIDGNPTTPCPTTAKPVPQVVDHEDPTVPPATRVPPKPTATTSNPTSDPTTQQPTKPPVTNDPPPTTPSNPPPPPDEPEEPDHPGLVGGLLDTILDTIGL